MKTISVKQPWASLICSSIKDIENRTWKCPQRYIGQRVLIHAGKTIDNNAVDKIAVFNGALAQLLQNGIYKNEFPLGCIIGSVEIVDCVINHPSIWAERAEKDPWYEYIHGEYQVINPIFNWVLANPILFDKPILNVKGKLGFWDFDLKNILCPICGNPAHTQFLGDVATDAFCMKCGKQCYKR